MFQHVSAILRQKSKQIPNAPALVYPKPSSSSLPLYSICLFLFLSLLLKQSFVIAILITIGFYYVSNNFQSSKPTGYEQITFSQFEKRGNYFAKLFQDSMDPAGSRVFVLLQPKWHFENFISMVVSLMKVKGKETLFILPTETGFKNFFDMIQEMTDPDNKYNKVEATKKQHAYVLLSEPIIHFLLFVVIKNLLRPFVRMQFKQVLLMTSTEQSFFMQQFSKFYSKCIGAKLVVAKSTFEQDTKEEEELPIPDVKPTDTCFWTNTTGSTGVPKIVEVTHGMVFGQLEAIFKLMQQHLHKLKNVQTTSSTPYLDCAEPLGKVITHQFIMVMTLGCIGLTTVIPDGVSYSSLKSLDADRLLDCIKHFDADFTYGSPIIWVKLVQFLVEQQEKTGNVEKYKLPENLKLMFCGGAPIPNKLHFRLKSVSKNPNLQLLTPYGATECLPMCCVGTQELLENECIQKTEQGYGVCVGKKCHGVNLIIDDNPALFVSAESKSDKASPSNTEGQTERSEKHAEDGIDRTLGLQDSELGIKFGEVLVHGTVASPSYLINDEANKMHKQRLENGTIVHRTGDVGYVDKNGRLWYCGRKVHCVKLKSLSNPDKTIIIPSVNVEGIVNQHELVRQSAFVQGKTSQFPFIALELWNREKNVSKSKQICDEVRSLVAQSPLWGFLAKEKAHNLQVLVFNKEMFPVDPRHNSKIERLKIADVIDELNKQQQ